MNISGWPFSVLVDGDPESGGGAIVTVDLAAPIDDEQAARMRYAFESFAVLAAAGGLGGDRIAPELSTASLTLPLPTPSGARSQWRFDRIAVDCRGLTVLFDMLALLAGNIRAIDVRIAGAGPRAAFGPHDLPPVWPRIPFAFAEDRTSKSVELVVEFAAVVAPADVETVTDAVGIWLDCGSVQGYRDWNQAPGRSFLVPQDDPRFVVRHNALTANLVDSGAHEGAYDILINVLIGLHAKLPIIQVEMV